MKTKMLIALLLAAVALAAFLFYPAYAQVTDTSMFDTLPPLPGGDFVVTPETTVDDLFNQYTLIYAGLVNLLMYLSGFFPKLGRIVPNLGLRVLAVGMVVAVVFKYTGLLDNWQLLAAFLSAVLGYDKVLKPLGVKTKKATPKE